MIGVKAPFVFFTFTVNIGLCIAINETKYFRIDLVKFVEENL